jgi:hypothetical protein
MNIIQRPWNPEKANCSYSSLSPHIERDKASDCTIHSLVTLGLLSLKKAKKISARIHSDDDTKGTSYPNLINYLGNRLTKNVSRVDIDSFENAKKILFQELQVGNATLIRYFRTNRTGHAILVYRPDQHTLRCADVQNNLDYPIDELIARERHNIVLISLLVSTDIGDVAPMEIKDSEYYLALGKKYKKTKRNRKTKVKRNKSIKKVVTQKKYIKMQKLKCKKI